MIVTGFTFNGGNTYEKYDYESLDNVPETDRGLLELDVSPSASEPDASLTAALTALGWLSDVIES